MRKMGALKALVAIAAVLAVVVAGQSTTSAHGDLVFHGDDMA